MSDIGSLLCGDESAEGIAKTALDQLSHSIANFSSRAVRFLNEDVSDDALAFGPFCARVLLENACAALVGRLDSFRMLYLCEFQAQPEYEHGKRARSAFSWFGDVIPEEKPTQPLWQLDVDFPKISRALFSPRVLEAGNRTNVGFFISSRVELGVGRYPVFGSGVVYKLYQRKELAAILDVIQGRTLGVLHQCIGV
jgi:hypothetical protein